MSSVKHIFGSFSESNEVFEGFKLTKITKTRPPLANSLRSSLELGILESKTQPNEDLVLVNLHRDFRRI